MLFRDYGLYDHAQIRFDPKNKISDNFYTRQDGTRAFYFSEKFLKELGLSVGFELFENPHYIKRQTINRKENIYIDRIFIQTKFKKPY